MKKVVLLLIFGAVALLCNAQSGRFRVAILDMRAGVNRTQSQVDGLVDMLSVELFNAGDFSMVERTQVDKVIQEQNFQKSNLSADQRKRIGGLLNADAIITGTVNYIIRDKWLASDGSTMTSGEYNVDIRMIEVSTGEILASAGDEQGSSTERELMRRIAKQLVRNYLGNRNVNAVSTEKKPYVLFGYLYVFPEDIAQNTTDYPYSLVEAINKNRTYGYNNWRLPTEDELAALKSNGKEIGLTKKTGRYNNYYKEDYYYFWGIFERDGSMYGYEMPEWTDRGSFGSSSGYEESNIRLVRTAE